MRQVLLVGQGEPLGQGVEHAPEFELTHHTLEVSRDGIGDNGFGSHRGHRPWVWLRSAGVAPPSMTVIQSGLLRAGLRYSPGSRANRAGASPVGARGGSAGVFSVALCSMAAVLVTETTSSSSARPQAVFTGSAP